MSTPTIPKGTYDCVVRAVDVRRRKKDQAWILEVIVRAIHADTELVVYQDLADAEHGDAFTLTEGQWASLRRFMGRLNIAGSVTLELAKLIYSGEVIQATVTHGGGHQQVVLSRPTSGSLAVAEWPDAEADSAPYTDAEIDEIEAEARAAGEELARIVDVSLTETAWIPQGDMPFDQWEAAGRELQRMGRAWQWWVGDWLNYGEARYGEKYAQAAEITDRANQTLRNVSWVARQIEPSRRRDDVDWSLHAEVAALEPAVQDRALKDAAEQGWTKRELRAVLRDEPVPVERVECPTCGSKVDPGVLPDG